MTPLRASQVETLRLAERFGGRLAVWQVVENLHCRDNWEAVLLLDTLADLGYFERLPSPSAQGTRMADESFSLTQLGKEALASSEVLEGQG